MLVVRTLRVDRWQEAILAACEVARSRPRSLSRYLRSPLALGRKTRRHRHHRPEYRPRILPIYSILNYPRPNRAPTTFGDISFTPRVLLHETKDLSLTAEVAALIPTGNQPLAGKTALTPAFAFWNNFADRWVIRGRIGDYIPLGGGGSDTLISELAIGQTLTDHDVRLFGDFTWYVSSVVNTPLRDGQRTSVTLTPGMRTHLGRDWYFLAGLPTPVTSQRVGDIGMIFWFMKAW
jgi:hypothetical protein